MELTPLWFGFYKLVKYELYPLAWVFIVPADSVETFNGRIYGVCRDRLGASRYRPPL
jgi:hypothetical protein